MKSLTKKILISLITGIIIIVFGAWGMGDLFSTGNRNIVAEIENKKIYIKDYMNEARSYVNQNRKSELNDRDHGIILNNLISEKIYEKFLEDLNLVINDQALANYIKNDQKFKNDNGVFSRTKYEKYILTNNINISSLENYYKKELIKKITVEVFINGITDTDYHIKKYEDDFLKQVNVKYFKINTQNNFTDKQINEYFLKNKSKYSLGEMRSGEYIKLSFDNLGYKDQNDQYYKTIDNIENDIINNLNYQVLIDKYKLKAFKIEKINQKGLNNNREFSNEKKFSKSLFSLNKNFSTEIIEINNEKYLIKLNNISLSDDILFNDKIKKEIISELNFIKNMNLSKEISHSKKNSFEEIANQNNLIINNFFFKNVLDNKGLFTEANMNKIFSSNKDDTIILQNQGQIFAIKISEISRSKSKIKNLKKVISNQVKQEFQSLILRDLDQYLLRKYSINLNEKVINQIKKSF